MKSSIPRFAASVLIVLFLSGCATTEPQPESQPPGLFETLDVNRDGQVTRNEFSQGMKLKVFRAMDQNGDGELTWEEWQKVDTSPHARQHFESMDSKKTGRITYEEFMQASGAYMDTDDVYISLDTSHDGILSRGETTGFQGVRLFTIRF
jgi:Ca2+-binding EF-hand superfamily protein